MSTTEELTLDVDRAHELFDVLEQVIDHPLHDDSERLGLSVVLADASLDFAFSVRLLCVSGQLLGASTCLRSQFEAVVRSVWAFHCATDNEVTRLSQTNLSMETQQGAKNIPQANEMLKELEKRPQLLGLTAALREFRDCAWQPSWLTPAIGRSLENANFVSSAYLLETHSSAGDQQSPGLLIWLVVDLAFAERAARLVTTAIQPLCADLDVIIDVAVHDESQSLPAGLNDPRILPIFTRIKST